jgi:hypothetical protein
MCNKDGSTLRPSTRLDIRQEMNATSRDRRSSLDTTTGRLICLALRSAAASCWRLSQCVSTFSALDLNKLTSDLQSLGSSKAHNGFALRFKAEAGFALLVGANTDVADDRCWHWSGKRQEPGRKISHQRGPMVISRGVGPAPDPFLTM